MSVRENLIAAKALIDTPEKWGRGRFRDATTGKSCVRGACAIATGSHFVSLKAKALEVVLCAELGPGVQPYELARWNDATTTTHADVMALFDRAIEASHDD